MRQGGMARHSRALGILAIIGLLLNALGPLLPMQHMSAPMSAGGMSMTMPLDASKAAAAAFVSSLDPHAICMSADESSADRPVAPVDKSSCPVCLTLRMIGPLAFVAVMQLGIVGEVAGSIERPLLIVPAPLLQPRTGDPRAPPHLS